MDIEKYIKTGHEDFESKLEARNRALAEYEKAQEELKLEIFKALYHEQLGRMYIFDQTGIARTTINRWMEKLEEETGLILPDSPANRG